MREPLQNQTIVKLYMLNTDGKKTGDEKHFTVESLIDDNEMGYVYCAQCDGIKGALVELYPNDENLNLSRDRYNTVKANKANTDEFNVLCDGFTQSVFTFQRADKYNSSCGFFANRIYKGFTKKGDPKGTVYMFSPEMPDASPFSSAVHDIASSDAHIQLRLSAVVTLYISLAKQFICLHNAGFCSENPDFASDFAVTEDGTVFINPSTEHITMPDDLKSGIASDISAFAFSFIKAIASLTEKNPSTAILEGDTSLIEACIPRDEFAYNRLWNKSNIGKSLLDIFTKSFSGGYESLDDLCLDLNKIRLAFAPSEFKKCTFEDGISMESFMETIPLEKSENPTQSVENLLFTQPLYDYTRDGKLVISVIGSFASAYKFIWYSEILCELLNKDIEIRHYIDTDESTTNGIVTTLPEVEFSLKANAKNKKSAAKICNDSDYIFIDYGTDEMNALIADVILKQTGDRKVLVAFASCEEKEYTKGTPVFVNKTSFTYTDDELCGRLVRMTAYDNADRNALFKKYKTPKCGGEYSKLIWSYMKLCYLLHSVSDGDDKACCDAIGDIISRGETARLISALHNTAVLDGSAEEKYNVSCSTTGILASLPAVRWPKNVETGMDELDELCIDECGKAYEEYRAIKNSPVFDSDEGKKSLLRDCVKTERLFRMLDKADIRIIRLFNDYIGCLDRILELSGTALASRDKLRSSLLGAIGNCEELTADQKKYIKSGLSGLEEVIAPAIRYMTLESPKKKYLASISKLGYIFDFRECDNLLIPFWVGANNNMLANMASVMVLKPKKVTFVSLSQSEQCFDKAIDTLRFVGRVIKNHNIGCVIHIEQYCAFETILRLGEFKLAANSIGATCNIHTCDSLFEGIDKIAAYCKKHKFSLIERNHSELSNMLMGAGIYKSIPSFEFDSSALRFTKTNRCTYLHGIPVNCSLKIEDMFEVTTEDTDNMADMIFDRARMFEFYSDNPVGWKKLAEQLDLYHQRRDLMLMLSRKDGKNPTYKPRSYIIDDITATTVREILDVLIKSGYASEESYVRYRSENSCLFHIETEYQTVAEFFAKALTGDRNILAEAGKLHTDYDATTNTVRIFSNTLFVENLPIPMQDIRLVEPLLHSLEKELYITGLRLSGSDGYRNISFTYATSAIKPLLTQAGKVLELHTYNSLKDCGEFDEVLCNCRIKWAGSDVSNEFDCIAVKGFTTVFVECKAQNRIDQNFYYKLGALVNKFGINPTGIIIADTNSDYFNGNNRMQIDRGNGLNIRTITDKTQIRHVGNTIAKLIIG